MGSCSSTRLLPEPVTLTRRILLITLMASTTYPSLSLVLDLVVYDVAHPFWPPILKHVLVPMLWFLCRDKSVLVFPHSTILVIWMIRCTIRDPARNTFPAALRAYEMPFSCVIDLTTNQNVAGFVTEITVFAESGGRCRPFARLRGGVHLMSLT